MYSWNCTTGLRLDGRFSELSHARRYWRRFFAPIGLALTKSAEIHTVREYVLSTVEARRYYSVLRAVNVRFARYSLLVAVPKKGTITRNLSFPHAPFVFLQHSHHPRLFLGSNRLIFLIPRAFTGHNSSIQAYLLKI